MLLPHTVTIQRVSSGSLDDRGVAAQTWADLTTASAWVQPKSVRELQQLSQSGPVISTHSIYVDPSADINEDDRVVYSGNVYQVDGVKDEAGVGHHFKVDAHLVETGSGFTDGFSEGFGE